MRVKSIVPLFSACCIFVVFADKTAKYGRLHQYKHASICDMRTLAPVKDSDGEADHVYMLIEYHR